MSVITFRMDSRTIKRGETRIKMRLQSISPAEDTVEDKLPTELQQLLQQFAPIFAPPTNLPPERMGDHKIPLLEGAQPFCLRPQRYNPTQKTEIETQIRDMLEKGWIQESTG